MARGRMLNQSIALDTEFNQMSMEAQFLYMRTIPHLDRDGLILGNPVALWAKIAPLMPSAMPAMESAIDEWIAAGLVLSYTTKHGSILYFLGFTKNQTGLRYDREAESMFPPPPGYHRNGNGLERDQENNDDEKPSATDEPTPPIAPDDDNHNSGIMPDGLRRNSGEAPPEVKLIEREVKAATRARTCEAEIKNTAAAAAPPVPDVFSEFKNEYERTWALLLSSEYEKEKVTDWTGRVTVQAWRYALRECADHRKVGQWKYLEQILRRVETEGLPAMNGGPPPVTAAQRVQGAMSLGLASI